MNGTVEATVVEKTCGKCGLGYFGKRCKPCWNIYMKAWSDANREKVRARDLIYGQAHREEAKQRAKKWRDDNLDRARANAKAWKAANPEKVKRYAKEGRLRNLEVHLARERGWKLANPELRRIQVQNRRARLRENGGALSRGIEAKLLALQKGLCACCKADLRKATPHLDHIVPVSKGGLHADENIQLLCASCNHSKSAKDPIDFMQSRGFLL